MGIPQKLGGRLTGAGVASLLLSVGVLSAEEGGGVGVDEPPRKARNSTMIRSRMMTAAAAPSSGVKFFAGGGGGTLDFRSSDRESPELCTMSARSSSPLS